MTADDDGFEEWMPGRFPPGRVSIAGDVILQSDDKRTFDELVCASASVHLEMLDDGTLWMEFIPAGSAEGLMLVVVAKKRGQLFIKATKDAA